MTFPDGTPRLALTGSHGTGSRKFLWNLGWCGTLREKQLTKLYGKLSCSVM